MKKIEIIKCLLVSNNEYICYENNVMKKFKIM